MPEQIRHISYCHEWSFTQLKDAASLTLKVQSLAMKHGMTLKDASAYNVQFRGPAPVFIDTLSFQANHPKPWAAYGQFCGHFLAPLALMAYVSPELRCLLRSCLEGVPLRTRLEVAARLDPFSARPVAASPLARPQHREVLDGARRGTSGWRSAVRGGDPKPAIVDSLSRTIAKLKLRKVQTEWIGYYDRSTHYSSHAENFKHEQVTSVLSPKLLRTGVLVRPGREHRRMRHTCDSPGNRRGLLRPRSALRQRELCAFQSRWGRAHAASSHGSDEPQPAHGVRLGRAPGLFRPGEAAADAGAGIAPSPPHWPGTFPLERIARFLAKLGNRLLIEYVPLEDPMAQLLVGNRPDIYGDYTAANFSEVFERYFDLERSAAIPETLRSLHLFRRRG